MQEVAMLSINDVSYDFCKLAHESGACLIKRLGLFEEQVKNIGAYTRQQRNLTLILSIPTSQTVKIFMGRKQQLPTATSSQRNNLKES